MLNVIKGILILLNILVWTGLFIMAIVYPIPDDYDDELPDGL